MTIPPPPRGFRGTLLVDDGARDAFAHASGPFQIRPRAVMRPLDADDVVGAVRWAIAHGHSLIPRGAGTGMPGGNVGPGIILDLTALDTLRSVEDDPLAVWVGPGVVGADLARFAEGRGAFIPALPSSADRCTLGGMVANNAAGARSFGYGAMRDWVEALEVVGADGVLRVLERHAPSPPAAFTELHRTMELPWETQVAPLWPEVRKNSSGYALDHFMPTGDPVGLMVGSEGTLGVVTRIRTRLAALPDERRVVLLPVPRLSELTEAVALAEEAGAVACEFLGGRFLDVGGLREAGEVGDALGPAEALLLLELDSRRGSPAEGVRTLEAGARAFGVPLLDASEPDRRDRLWGIRHAASPVIASRATEGLVSMQFVEDSVVPPGGLVRYLEGLQDILESERTDAVTFGHAGDGNVHVNPLIDVTHAGWRERVRRILYATARLVADLGGTLSGEHGDGRVRTPLGPIVWGDPAATAFRTVKEALDPSNTFNPGVIVPLPGQDPLDGLMAWGRVR